MKTIACVLFASCTALGLTALACGSDDSSPPATPEDAGATQDSATPSDGSASDSAPIEDAGGGPVVTFRYTPQWKGVKSVDVIGGFGKSDDWKAPVATLTDDGTGTFTGTASLANGTYLYVFHVVGDEAEPKPDTFERYAIDPSVIAFAPCPADSPTFAKDAPNPCGQLTVPAGATPPTYHVRAVVTVGNKPAAGYFVEIERQEPKSHHFFANRTTTGTDGSFELVAGQGNFRFQVLHPSFFTQNDTQRDPATLAAMRRSISDSIAIAGDVTLNGPDVAYAGYAAMHPTGDAAALPTTFSYALAPGASAVRAAVYGPAQEIGDPWFVSPNGKATTAEFDGGFNTAKATDPAAKPGTRYFWGTEQTFAGPDGGVTWTGQSMVFPITWP